MISLNATQQALVDSTSKEVCWLFEVVTVAPVTYYWSTKTWTDTADELYFGSDRLYFDADTLEFGAGGQAYTFKILPESFRGVTLQSNLSQYGTYVPNELEFEITNSGNVLTDSDFNNAEVHLKLVLTDGPTTEIIRQWKYIVETAKGYYQKIKFTCKDFVASVMEGDYPNGKYIDEIFDPYSDDLMPNDAPAYCIPIPFGTCYIPLRVVSSTGYCKCYFLGSDDYTFTVAEVTSPRSLDCRQIWGSGDADFRILSKTDQQVQTDWKLLYPHLMIIDGSLYSGTHTGANDAAILTDSGSSWTNDVLIGRRVINSTDSSAAYITDNDGTTITGTLSGGTDNNWDTGDAYYIQSSGIWVVNGKYQEILAKFSRNDTSSVTAPGDVLEWVLEDMGVASADIDSAGTFTSCNTTYSGWGLAFNGAFYFKRLRTKIIAELLNSCNSVIDVDTKVKLRVLSKTSQKTLTNADILSDSFKTTFLKPNEFDSGVVSFQETGKPQDIFLKITVPAKSTKVNPSKEILNIPFVQDSQDIQALGTLYYQRKNLMESRSTFNAKSNCLALQPHDAITINHANYGGSYDVVVDKMTIASDCTTSFTVIKYSENLDDFGDLSPVAASIGGGAGAAFLNRTTWSTVVSGPDHITPGTGYGPHVLPGKLRIGESATNCLYADSYMGYISVLVSGTTRARMGNLNGLLDYSTDVYGFACSKDANTYVAIDPTNGVRISAANASAITIKSGGDIDLEAGGDINMQSITGTSDSSTSNINFVTQNRTISLRTSYDNDSLNIITDSDGNGVIYIGVDLNASTRKRPSYFGVEASNDIHFLLWYDANGFCRFDMDKNATVAELDLQAQSGAGKLARIYMYADTSDSKYIRVTADDFFPSANNTTSFGVAGNSYLNVFTYTLSLPEIGSAPTPVSNYGQLFTKADNLLYFCDGDGTEYTVNLTAT